MPMPPRPRAGSTAGACEGAARDLRDRCVDLDAWWTSSTPAGGRQRWTTPLRATTRPSTSALVVLAGGRAEGRDGRGRRLRRHPAQRLPEVRREAGWALDFDHLLSKTEAKKLSEKEKVGRDKVDRLALQATAGASPAARRPPAPQLRRAHAHWRVGGGASGAPKTWFLVRYLCAWCRGAAGGGLQNSSVPPVGAVASDQPDAAAPLAAPAPASHAPRLSAFRPSAAGSMPSERPRAGRRGGERRRRLAGGASPATSATGGAPSHRASGSAGLYHATVVAGAAPRLRRRRRPGGQAVDDGPGARCGAGGGGGRDARRRDPGGGGGGAQARVAPSAQVVHFTRGGGGPGGRAPQEGGGQRRAAAAVDPVSGSPVRSPAAPAALAALRRARGGRAVGGSARAEQSGQRLLSR